METPEGLYYLDTHEWLRVEDGVGAVGITDFAQDELGDVIFLELPEEGETVARGDQFGSIESMKADSELYAPVSGEIVDVHEEVADYPQWVNDDPYGDGWMIRIEIADESELDDLLSAEEYVEEAT